jgi:serine/threonine protein kinase
MVDIRNWTFFYMSPEMIYFKILNNKINVNLKTNIWSLGIVIYELITLQFPFKNEEEILDSKVPDLDTNVPDIFKNMIKKYIKYD